MSATQLKRIPWPLLPFAWLWGVLALVIELTGRVIAAVVGLAFMAIGIVLSVTLIAAPVGIPLTVLGFLLMLRSVF